MEEEQTFEENINDLHSLHCITKYNHIIEYKRDTWKLFEPTKFVYAYNVQYHYPEKVSYGLFYKQKGVLGAPHYDL